jgi:hypothetical protein
MRLLSKKTRPAPGRPIKSIIQCCNPSPAGSAQSPDAGEVEGASHAAPACARGGWGRRAAPLDSLLGYSVSVTYAEMPQAPAAPPGGGFVADACMCACAAWYPTAQHLKRMRGCVWNFEVESRHDSEAVNQRQTNKRRNLNAIGLLVY